MGRNSELQIVLISGSINSGKSTVAKLLAQKLGNTAVVEVDALRDFIAWMPLQEAVPLNLKNAASVTRNFVQEGMNVVIPYPLSKANYDHLVADISTLNVPIHAFTLAPTLEVALQNRGDRELTEWEIERIKHHYDIGINSPEFGIVLDNGQQTAADTVSEMMNRIST